MCKSSPAPDPLIGQSAQANAALAKESLDFYKGVYQSDLLPMQKEQAALSKDLITRYMSNMDKQDKFADDQNAYYDSTFKPIEKQMADEAQNYDSQDNVTRRSGIAGANVAQQFSNAQQQTTRNLARYGVNPNSSAFAETNGRLMRDQALATAGAETGAAFDTVDKGIALRAGAANFGRNMPNTASNYYTLGNQSAGGAMGTSSSAMANVNANAGMMQQGFGTAIQGNQSAGYLANMDFQDRMKASEQSNAATSSIFKLVGQGAAAYMTGGTSAILPGMFGGKADGGAIRGPGGPVDDQVPTMLSNGEFVVSADVVRAKGLEFFKKLQEKYHTPADQQRRRAIGGA